MSHSDVRVLFGAVLQAAIWTGLPMWCGFTREMPDLLFLMTIVTTTMAVTKGMGIPSAAFAIKNRIYGSRFTIYEGRGRAGLRPFLIMNDELWIMNMGVCWWLCPFLRWRRWDDEEQWSDELLNDEWGLCRGGFSIRCWELWRIQSFFSKWEVLVQKKCIFAVSFYHTAQVTKTVSVDFFDSDVQHMTVVSLRSFYYVKGW